MKKVISVVLMTLASIVVALLIAGGSYLAVAYYNMSITHFDEYQISSTRVYFDEVKYAENYDQMLDEQGYHVSYPHFMNTGRWGYTMDLVDCYAEVDNACIDYAVQISNKYHNMAVLDAEVDYTPTVLTITFTGTGYPENGEPENLDRTYIFDIDGAGRDKLPILLNKAEIFGE